jgi:hypothetical protein
MTAHASLFYAAASSGQPPKSVFGSQPPAQQPVKEVVSFLPGPDPYRAIERASQRIADGKSVFLEDNAVRTQEPAR